MHADEWQFDGLVGPTHNYAGLSPGNVASLNNAGQVSNPRLAALQGLKKMQFVQSLGMKQAFLPPHKRPVLKLLHDLGFQGKPAYVLEQAHKIAPELLAAAFSSSYMWTANAATVAPSADTRDGRVHFTPANLISHTHRSIEAEVSGRHLRAIFYDERHFCVHDPLPATSRFSDEGAANHMRMCSAHGEAGVHVFVYGTSHNAHALPKKFVARQTRAACEAIIRLHQLDPDRCILVQQHPDAIDAGVFHHDVIGMNTTDLMIHHEHSVIGKKEFLEEIKKQNNLIYSNYIEIDNKSLTIEDAVASYFFNSQLLALPDGAKVVVAPKEAEENPSANAAFTQLVQSDGLIAKVHYLDVRESMRNGGGPACLRLRVVLSEVEAAAMHQGIVMNDAKYNQIENWIKSHYRDRMHPNDLRDPLLIDALDAAYESLAQLIDLPNLYHF